MDENAPPPPPPFTPPPVPHSAAPPPPIPPPPVLVAAPAAAPRRGRGWMVFALVLLVLFGVSFLYNVRHFFTSGHSHGKSLRARSIGPRLEEVLTEDNDAANKIAVVEIEGIITSRSIDQSGYNMVD